MVSKLPDAAWRLLLRTLSRLTEKSSGIAFTHAVEVVRTREIQVEVESVVYVVCDALGLDTGDYSFAYVARWSDGSNDLKETGERVIACAKEILTSLEATRHNGCDVEQAS